MRLKKKTIQLFGYENMSMNHFQLPVHSLSLGSWKPLTYSRNRKKTVTRICVVNGFVRPISLFFDKEIGRAFRALTNPFKEKVTDHP